MKLYNRTSELYELERIKHLSFNDSSRMTVVTGRRRIGKTSLILKATADSPTVYLFIGRKPKKLQTGIVGYKGSSTKTKSAYEV